MKELNTLNVKPDMKYFWRSIGYNFEDLNQVIHELIDNSISNYRKYPIKNKIINITFTKLNDGFYIIVEDHGTGINNIEESLRLGGSTSKETTLNEHSFGLKQALAASNPENDNWQICTRTKDDSQNNQYKIVLAPYQFSNLKIYCEDGNCFCSSETGTIIKFKCTNEWFNSITREFKDKNSGFESILELLRENLGVYYSYIIQNEKIKIMIKGIDEGNEQNIFVKEVEAIMPCCDCYVAPGKGRLCYDLGNGEIDIDYKFILIKNNETTKKFYKKNMESSGVEIRINGRLIEVVNFQRIWKKTNHPNYNGLIVIVDLISNNQTALPATKTTKTSLNQSDPLTNKLFELIKTLAPDLSKLVNKKINHYHVSKIINNFLPSNIIDIDYNITEKVKAFGKVKLDCIVEKEIGYEIYLVKKKNSSIVDLYNIEKYWDLLEISGKRIDKAILIAKKHSKAVLKLVNYINDKSVHNKYYHIQLVEYEGLVDKDIEKNL